MVGQNETKPGVQKPFGHFAGPNTYKQQLWVQPDLTIKVKEIQNGIQCRKYLKA